MLKRCNQCKKKLEESQFYWNKTNKKYFYACKSCRNKNIAGKYFKTEKGKKAVNKASKKAYEKHKEKWITRAKTHYAIKTGVIIKPNKCEVCEKKCSGHALQAHHEDYTKPLQVIFLCYSCHADADRELEIV